MARDKGPGTKPDLNDCLIAIGLILLGAGLWLVAPWLSLAAIGFSLAALGLIGSLR